MPLDTTEYLRARQPLDLRELVEEKAVEHLINGFTYRIGAGVTIIYRDGGKCGSGEPSLARQDALVDAELAKEFFHSFCSMYRTDSQCEKRCMACDEAAARRYVSGEWRTPTLYRCHNQLWEMAYPISVGGGDVLAVLVGGQLIVTEGAEPSAEELAEWQIGTDWSTVKFPGVPQVESILAACGPKSPALAPVLEKWARDRPTRAEGLRKRWRDFCEFGELMKSLLTAFHRLRLRNAEESLLLQVSTELTNKAAVEETYWDEVARMCQQVSEVVGMGPVDVYSRSRSRYIQKVAKGELIDKGTAPRIPVFLTLELKQDCLLPVSDLNLPSRLSDLISPGQEARLFKWDLPAGNNRSLSTILVVHRCDSGVMHRFAEQFCRVIAQRCDVQSLLSEILDGREDFDNRVRRASHASKTPLQAAVSTVELLESPDNHGTLEQYRKELRAVRHLIHRAAMELTENLIGSTEPRKVLDLRALVASLAEEMRPIAMRREITLRYDRPTLRVPVAVSELEIRTALRNLLDNAVKYSYSPQEVRIVLDICGTTARLAIKNYGLGIDEGKLTEIFELGVRGNVADHKAERAGHVRGGTGLGLFLALTDIEAHAGTLDLSSVPAAAARPSEPLHRYLTTATVTLPISAEERDE